METLSRTHTRHIQTHAALKCLTVFKISTSFHHFIGCKPNSTSYKTGSVELNMPLCVEIQRAQGGATLLPFTMHCSSLLILSLKTVLARKNTFGTHKYNIHSIFNMEYKKHIFWKHIHWSVIELFTEWCQWYFSNAKQQSSVFVCSCVVCVNIYVFVCWRVCVCSMCLYTSESVH